MTNIVTGANGFIGQQLLKKLDAETTTIDHKYLQVGVAGDYDRMFFLSTYGNMAHHTDNYMMLRANVMDLIRIIARNPNYLIYMSSSSVTLQIQTPYSRTKRAAEEILQALPELKSCIVRPYSVTGVGEQKEHLIPTLIRSCMEGEEMPFDPYPVHDFIDVEDVVGGLLFLAERGVTGIFEFGRGVPITNQEVREVVEAVCGKKANVKINRDLRPYDTSTWFCQKPQFKPAKSFKQSIEEMAEAYKHEHNN